MAEEASTQGRRSSQARRQSAPRSGVWVHFTRFTDAGGNDKAECKRCKQVLGANTKSGTSTLREHIRICWGEEAAAASKSRAAPAPQAQAQLLLREEPAAAAADGLQGTERRWEDLARMIALHGYDSSFVEDEYFRSFVRGLSPEFEVPSREAIEDMCDGIFDDARKDLLDRLRRAPGRVSVAVGKAKTIEAGEVFYAGCHFINDEWNLCKWVLDAAFVYGPDRERDYGPILGVHVTLDNYDWVLNNVILWHGIEDRLSLVAYETSDDSFQNILKRTDLISCSTTTYVDNVLHKIAGYLLPDDDFAIELYYVIHDLQLTRQKRQQLLSRQGLDDPWTYDENWYSCYCSLKIINKEDCSSIDENIDYLLLCTVWGAIYQAIQRISASTGPTSNLCLRELFNVREVLQSELARVTEYYDDFSGETKCYFEDSTDAMEVLTEATDTLNKAIQDSYLIWSVPLALDPRYKLEYIKFSFQRVFGSEAADKVSTVKTRIDELYDYYYSQSYGTTTDADHSGSTNAMMATTSTDPPLQQAWNEHCRSQDVIMGDQANSSSCPETHSELRRYLQDRRAPQTQDFDVLNWWKGHSSEYPTVALMAREALAMPTCSKLCSDQMAQVRSILRGYSKELDD